jgi:hypothetical protein
LVEPSIGLIMIDVESLHGLSEDLNPQKILIEIAPYHEFLHTAAYGAPPFPNESEDCNEVWIWVATREELCEQIGELPAEEREELCLLDTQMAEGINDNRSECSSTADPGHQFACPACGA